MGGGSWMGGGGWMGEAGGCKEAVGWGEVGGCKEAGGVVAGRVGLRSGSRSSRGLWGRRWLCLLGGPGRLWDHGGGKQGPTAALGRGQQAGTAGARYERQVPRGAENDTRSPNRGQQVETRVEAGNRGRERKPHGGTGDKPSEANPQHRQPPHQTRGIPFPDSFMPSLPTAQSSAWPCPPHPQPGHRLQQSFNFAQPHRQLDRALEVEGGRG